MTWRNKSELKQNSKSIEDRQKEAKDDILCNITKHKPYLDVNFQGLEHFKFVHSDEEEEDNTEFSMINPDLLDLQSWLKYFRQTVVSLK